MLITGLEVERDRVTALDGNWIVPMHGHGFASTCPTFRPPSARAYVYFGADHHAGDRRVQDPLGG